MESRLVQSAARKPWITYGLAVGAPLAALLMRLPLSGILGDKVPYITFFLAAAICASYGGLGPGLLATALSAALAVWFVVIPREHFDVGDGLGLALFCAISGLISYLSGRLLDARHHENALRILFQQTLVSVGDALISTDDAMRVRLMNPVAEQLTGWKQSEAKGRPISEVFVIVREGSDEPAEIPVERILRTGRAAGLANHTELIDRSGRRTAIDDSGAPIHDLAGNIAGTVLVFRDISGKRFTERELEASERRARTILESISDAFILLDEEWRFKQVNPVAEKVLGTPAVALLGRKIWETHPGIAGTKAEALYRKAVAENSPVAFENYYAPWDRWFDISASPSNEGLGIYFRDITERKRTEAALLRLNEDLRQFTFAATHDFREPLRMITVYAQLLQRGWGAALDDQAREHLGRIVEGAQRISRLIDGLLEFSRVGEIDKAAGECARADAALKEALDNLRIALAEHHGEVTHEPLPPVIANSVHLCQVFQNLIGNALKYHEAGVAPQVHVSARRADGQCIFAVRDNGMGIAPEYQDQIFTPFKRLHGAEFAGAGIGLATCKRIVEHYGGRIWVESSLGEGSTFYFSLPAAEGTAHAS